KYMRGKGVGVEYKSRLYRLAHDLAVSSFGMRQEVYEYWHGGDPNRNRINLPLRLASVWIPHTVPRSCTSAASVLD
ncbi:MAG TPA: 4-hydroxyphenylacetate 3-hydroxylase C-terminal domain-containing protein, partial [Dehalococcoidia bacterium]|nr:4-hydroxyphenylacetate 3-hydroxylase C-terminal domain-containing protein [Dehalococcoidia bacterium]